MLAAVLAVVITHAHVLTLSAAQPIASTLAIVDGKIAYAGNDEAAARHAAGPGAALLDAHGHTVVPGFNDAHVHFGLSITLGGSLGVDVPTLPKRAWLEAIAEAARSRPAGQWLFVKSDALPDGVSRGVALDFVGRPLFVVTQHGALLNHRAMALCKLTEAQAPRGFIDGREVLDGLERAIRVQPQPLLAARAREFLAELARLGITSAQLISDELPELFDRLRVEGALTARVRFVPFGYRFDNPIYHSDWHGDAPDWVRVDGVKYFHDDWARITRYELREIYDAVTKANRRVVLHVLSHRALDSFLDAIERMSRDEPEKARLFRVDHADDVSQAEAERLARLGIIVCSNPSMLPEWHRADAFPMHTLAAAGVRTCIGTDWVGRHVPRRTLSPLESIELAVTHGGYGTAERIDSAQALEAYTVGSAAAEGMQDKKGTLAPGMFADLVVLSADPTAVAPDRIGAIDVLLTMVGGRIVYRRGGFAAPPPASIGAPRPPAPPTIGPPRAAPPTFGPARTPPPQPQRR
jgi:predicted amidohydrolase YtcJ